MAELDPEVVKQSLTTVVGGTHVNTNSCAKFKLFVLAVTQVPAQSVDTPQPLPAVFPPVEEPTLVVNLSDVPDGTLGELEISQPYLCENCLRDYF